jgi:hypothetical protein
MNHTLHVGHGATFGAVTLFPVWTDAPGLNGLDWSGAGLRVAEREGAPVVGELVVQNTGAKPVVLLEGDLLAGGWQDRMVAASTIIGRGEGRGEGRGGRPGGRGGLRRARPVGRRAGARGARAARGGIRSVWARPGPALRAAGRRTQQRTRRPRTSTPPSSMAP